MGSGFFSLSLPPNFIFYKNLLGKCVKKGNFKPQMQYLPTVYLMENLVIST